MRRIFVLLVLAILVFGAPAVWAFAHHAARWMDHPTSGPTPSQIVTNRVAAYGHYVGPTP